MQYGLFVRKKPTDDLLMFGRHKKESRNMSLVAYGSSDESDKSEAEDATPAPVPTPVAAATSGPPDSEDGGGGGHISDDDDDPRAARQQLAEGDNIDNLLKGLPAPRDAGEGIIEETDELEEEVKPKAAELKDAPKPPPKKVKQPVKITIPALPDSDEEDGEPARKKPKPAAQGKSGLTSLLPPPVHAAKKETNRILLPYSLGKKSKPASASAQQRPTAKQTDSAGRSRPTNLPQYGSDSEDEDGDDTSGGNFFSLDSTSKDTTITTTLIGPSLRPPPVQGAGQDNKDSVPTVPLPPTTETETPAAPTVPLPPSGLRPSMNLPAPQNKQTAGGLDPVTQSDGQSETTDLGPLPGLPLNQDAPLTFKGGVSSRPTYYQQMSASSSTSDSGVEDGGASASMFYNMPYDGTSSYPEVTDNAAFQHDEEFLRMQGKHQRGKEQISIMDVNADDYTSPGDLAKYLTEETTPHRSKKSLKEDQPTHVQKRKHQIQFLAFEAKERELELKNTWSNNKMTKRQTQAKYGF